jgi:hypothetical protein
VDAVTGAPTVRSVPRDRLLVPQPLQPGGMDARTQRGRGPIAVELRLQPRDRAEFARLPPHALRVQRGDRRGVGGARVVQPPVGDQQALVRRPKLLLGVAGRVLDAALGGGDLGAGIADGVRGRALVVDAAEAQFGQLQRAFGRGDAGVAGGEAREVALEIRKLGQHGGHGHEAGGARSFGGAAHDRGEVAPGERQVGRGVPRRPLRGLGVGGRLAERQVGDRAGLVAHARRGEVRPGEVGAHHGLRLGIDGLNDGDEGLQRRDAGGAFGRRQRCGGGGQALLCGGGGGGRRRAHPWALGRLAASGPVAKHRRVGAFVVRTGAERIASRPLGCREDALGHGPRPARTVPRR